MGSLPALATAAAAATLLLPTLAVAGEPVAASPARAAIAGVIALATYVAVSPLARTRSLALLGAAAGVLCGWLLSQASYWAAGWIIAPLLGAAVAFVCPLRLEAPRAAASAVLVSAAALVVVRVFFGRAVATDLGSALVALGGMVALVAVPGRLRPSPAGAAVGFVAVVAALLTTGYIGATTPRAAWFGSLVSHGPRDRPQVALTFDDGPDVEYTLAVRDILDRYGAKGTFFSVGKAVDARPDISRALLDDGHLLGNHSYRHDAVRWLDPRYPELAAGESAIKRNLGVCPAFYRPPHGTHTPFISREAGEHGMTVVTWDVSAGDWATTDGQLVASRVLDRVRPGSIIDLHDGLDGKLSADRSVLLTALPLILEGLEARGLQPVTLDQLLGRPGYLESC